MTVPAYALNETLLQVENVSQKLGGNQILRDVDFTIKNITRPGVTTGQVVALLGPSGVGKTRLFRILAGLDAPDTGAVKIGVDGKPVDRGMVGVVFQNYPLFEHRTILGNLMVAARRTTPSADTARKKALELLERFGLADHASKYPAQLSGGQRQRVSIAQQFLCSNHFLLMDEPFSGLDPVAVDNVCELVSEVANMHDLNTIILTTHNIEAGLEVADTVLLLGRDRDASGRIVPGAKIQGSFDLIERGLAWRKDIDTDPEFLKLLGEIRHRFKTL